MSHESPSTTRPTRPSRAPSRSEAADGFGRVESVGVELIPDQARTSTPRNVFAVFAGGNLAFSVIVFGWLPVTFGLGWAGAVASSFTGLLIGTVMIAPMALLGPRTGTNNTVSSGAHFGVTGRLIGSGLTLLFALAYAAIAVWTSGDALVAALHRLAGTPEGNGALAVGYALIAAEIVVVALYGHGTVVAMQRFVLPVLAVLLLLGVVAFAGSIDSGRPGGGYLLGSYWPTWWLAVAISVGGPLSYAPTVGDYTRRISRRRHSDARILAAACGGIFLGLFGTSVFGSLTASAFSPPGVSYVGDLVDAAPVWYVVPIVLIALAGGLGQGVLNIYASGLDLEALVPRLRRTHTTLITSLVAVALMYLGVFVVDAVDSITAMTLVLNAFAGPWVAVNVIGFLVARRGAYDQRDVQAFNEGRHGGRYWFTHGWNLRAVLPWAAGSAFGLLSVNTALYAGPLADIAGGVDVSLLGSAVIAGCGYLVALWVWPENVPPVDEEQWFDDE